MASPTAPVPPPPPWRPPTAEALTAHLDAHAPRTIPPARRLLPLAPLAVAAAAALFIGGGAWLLPWAALIGTSLWARAKVGRHQSLTRRVERAHELARLRFNRPALRSAWRLIPLLTTHRALQHQAVAVLARGLEQTHQYDAALACYERLQQDLPPTTPPHPGTLVLGVRRTVAQLLSGRLADADQSLRRVRHAADPLLRSPPSGDQPPTDEHPSPVPDAGPLPALVCFARLLHATSTAHFADAIAETPNLIDDLRPLGLDAGYGYALRALCHHHREQPDDDTHARRWWQRAVALINPADLTLRLPDVRPLARAFADTAVPHAVPDASTPPPPGPPPAEAFPFTPARLQRELTRDRLLRSLVPAVPVAVLLAGLLVTAWPPAQAVVSAGVLFGVGWLALGLVQAPVAVGLSALGPLLQAHPRAGVTALQKLAARPALSPGLRVALYRSAAEAAHRLHHTAAAAHLAADLLTRIPPPDTSSPAAALSTSAPSAALWLILADAHLTAGDPAAAWPALHALTRTAVTLDQGLKRLVLRTRYEVAIGAHADALADAPARAQLSGLMPLADTRALHRDLLTAAQSAGDASAIAWLAPRVALLGS